MHSFLQGRDNATYLLGLAILAVAPVDEGARRVEKVIGEVEEGLRVSQA